MTIEADIDNRPGCNTTDCELNSFITVSQVSFYIIYDSDTGEVIVTHCEAHSLRYLLTVYNPCSRFTICAHGLQSVRAHGLQSVLTVYNPCSRFTIRAHGLQSMLTVYNPCSWFTICAHVLQSVLTLYNLCSRFNNPCSRFTVCANLRHKVNIQLR